MIAKETLRTWGRYATRLLLSLGLLAVVAAIIALIFWKKFQQIDEAMSAPPPPEMPIAVSLVDVVPAPFRHQTVIVGSVMADQSVQLRNETTGVVKKVMMVPGGRVDEGDVLVQFDDRIEQADLKIAQATFQLAEAALARSLRLSQANANSQQEYEVAEAEAARAKAECERLVAMIDRKTIVARFDAKVGLFNLHPGQYLLEGSEITTLEGIADFLLVEFAMPAHVADAIKINETVSMRFDELPQAVTAKIVALDSRANAVSRSLKARARIEKYPETLRPGDSVRITVGYGPEIPALAIPATAVRRSPTGSMVYVAAEELSEEDPDAPPTLRAVSRSITLAGSNGETNYIVDGLKSGDRVVSDGSFKVMEGSLLNSMEGEAQ